MWSVECKCNVRPRHSLLFGYSMNWNYANKLVIWLICILYKLPFRHIQHTQIALCHSANNFRWTKSAQNTNINSANGKWISIEVLHFWGHIKLFVRVRTVMRPNNDGVWSKSAYKTLYYIIYGSSVSIRWCFKYFFVYGWLNFSR